MTITLSAFTGTQTVGTTEWSLTTGTSGPDVETTVGTYQAFVDFSAVVAGDEFELRCYEKVLSGGTQRLSWKATIAEVQAYPHYVSPALILGMGWDLTLIKKTGTDRSISWRIAKAA